MIHRANHFLPKLAKQQFNHQQGTQSMIQQDSNFQLPSLKQHTESNKYQLYSNQMKKYINKTQPHIESYLDFDTSSTLTKPVKQRYESLYSQLEKASSNNFQLTRLGRLNQQQLKQFQYFLSIMKEKEELTQIKQIQEKKKLDIQLDKNELQYFKIFAKDKLYPITFSFQIIYEGDFVIYLSTKTQPNESNFEEQYHNVSTIVYNNNSIPKMPFLYLTLKGNTYCNFIMLFSFAKNEMKKKNEQFIKSIKNVKNSYQQIGDKELAIEINQILKKKESQQKNINQKNFVQKNMSYVSKISENPNDFFKKQMAMHRELRIKKMLRNKYQYNYIQDEQKSEKIINILKKHSRKTAALQKRQIDLIKEQQRKWCFNWINLIKTNSLLQFFKEKIIIEK